MIEIPGFLVRRVRNSHFHQWPILVIERDYSWAQKVAELQRSHPAINQEALQRAREAVRTAGAGIEESDTAAGAEVEFCGGA